MIPRDQEFMVDRVNGIYGDCQRACIASILDLEMSAVPHFLQLANGEYQAFEDAITSFMSARGLQIIEQTDTVGIMPLEYHMIYGLSPRSNGDKSLWHAVVGLGGLIVHDPHPSRSGLLPSRWVYARVWRLDDSN